MTQMDLQSMVWLNPPPSCEIGNGRLSLATGRDTDFWQTTYYGFRRDNGHFLHARRTGDFTLEASFSGRYDALYDQAGLMLRHDATTWVKCGVEMTDGAAQFSVVVTRGFSDWSAFRLDHDFDRMSVRLTRNGDALFIQYRTNAMADWRMARLAYFPPEHAEIAVGLMACSPQREGLEVEFSDVRLGDPVSRDIH